MYYYSESYYHEEGEMANDPRYDAVYDDEKYHGSLCKLYEDSEYGDLSADFYDDYYEY